jgi:RNA recognition motif-containing protein
LRNTFSAYGTIKSLKRDINPQTNQPFAFICFEDNENKELGPTWAQKAVDDLHEKVITEDGKEYRLYVSRALKKKERESEKKKELLRYKNSKKRCNLYIKNFPPETTEQSLRELFSAYGTIESIKIFPEGSEGKTALYAFVCFEKPENAFEAKTQLH